MPCVCLPSSAKWCMKFVGLLYEFPCTRLALLRSEEGMNGEAVSRMQL